MRHGKILIVDDEEPSRDLLSRRLARRGFETLTAHNGARALELVEQHELDLVLLDINMPKMSGLDVLKAIRDKWDARALPVIMATASASSEDMVEALEIGANDYVTKPFDFPVLLARIEAQLRLRRPSRGAVDDVAGAPGQSSSGVGALLDGRYRLEERIGAGAFGVVYRARQLSLDRPIAIKLLHLDVAERPVALERFRREGVAASRLRHPSAVNVVDFGLTPDGVAYLAMELLEGPSLAAILEQEGRLPEARAVHIAAALASVLVEAHALQILHRDLKPSNVVLNRGVGTETVKVLDFGLAKIVGDELWGRTLTTDNMVVGTLAFMAPERFRGEPDDGGSDVYSLGVILHRMLSGALPFATEGKDPMAIAMLHMHKPPLRLRNVAPEVPAALDALVWRMLAKDANRRPTAAQVHESLSRLVPVVPQLPATQPPPGPSAAPPQRKAGDVTTRGIRRAPDR